ncbi:transporter [Pedobacter flavus]|uniref:Transporter n=1 Tax=Pedobacter flavus TaxID=3113906 RepID=A0ABU7H0R4_9SPHI|nr:transporter [Pedobacter sp. VNH31]MEE1884116.1 transporter [Pedobacter sp. VNH31]
MKKKIILIALLSSCTFTLVRACDICGCGVGSYYLGLLPEFNKRFAGLRYQHKSLATHLGPNGERTPISADETYQSTELWGGVNFGKKFRVLAFIPYNFNEKVAQTGNGSKNGLGDIALMGYYGLADHRTSVGQKLLVQSLWVGAGVKLPTGKYEPSERLAVSESPNNFQLGTASTDFTLNATYDIRLQDLGLNVNLNYKINTENKHNYRYGKKFTSNILLYHKFRIAKLLTIAPNIGVLYETAEKDMENKKYEIETSGGYSLSAIAGMEFSFKRISMGTNYQNVHSQALAGRRALAGNRWMIHTSFAF